MSEITTDKLGLPKWGLINHPISSGCVTISVFVESKHNTGYRQRSDLMFMCIYEMFCIQQRILQPHCHRWQC